jgi:hypothetical protein
MKTKYLNPREMKDISVICKYRTVWLPQSYEELTVGWETRNTYRNFVEKPNGKRPLATLRRRWEDNIKMYLREIGC